MIKLGFTLYKNDGKTSTVAGTHLKNTSLIGSQAHCLKAWIKSLKPSKKEPLAIETWTILSLKSCRFVVIWTQNTFLPIFRDLQFSEKEAKKRRHEAWIKSNIVTFAYNFCTVYSLKLFAHPIYSSFWPNFSYFFWTLNCKACIWK